jgi:hypothetical protein
MISSFRNYCSGYFITLLMSLRYREAINVQKTFDLRDHQNVEGTRSVIYGEGHMQ